MIGVTRIRLCVVHSGKGKVECKREKGKVECKREKGFGLNIG